MLEQQRIKVPSQGSNKGKRVLSQNDTSTRDYNLIESIITEQEPHRPHTDKASTSQSGGKAIKQSLSQPSGNAINITHSV